MPGETLLRIYEPDEARATLLARKPVGDVDVTPTLAASIQRVFGEQLTPDEAVRRVLADVRARGDAALRDWTGRIDGVALQDLAVPPQALERAYRALAPDLRDAMGVSIDRVRTFHQKQPSGSWLDWSPGGGALGQMVRPLERVGVYAPGGRAPYPSTLIMCVVPAQVAGVEEIVVATPPGRDGEPASVVLAAAYACGVEQVYRVGGAQAVGALAYGTQSIPRVDKIVGPGNIFVVLAKRQVYGLVDIDGLPGPTETLVVADAEADPALVAADLLAQAEHDTLASAILVTPSRSLAEAVQVEVARQMEELSRADIITESLRGQGGIVLCAGLDEALDLANLYAAEHLCLHVADPWSLVGLVKHAGGVFLGENSYEVLGDYVAGPTHVMPTMGTARFASPLSVRDFTKIISLFAVGEGEAREIGKAAQTLAEAEGLTAHAAAVARRARNETWREKAKSFLKAAMDYTNKNRPDESAWARGLSPKTLERMSSREFLAEYCWVVYAAGFRVSVLARKFKDLENAFEGFELERLYRMQSVEPALAVINHRRKAEGFLKGAKLIYEEGFSKFKERVQTSGMSALRRLPYIGEVTQKHLARNVGILDVSKDDIWLKRLAEKLKVADVPQLTSYLADESGEREGVVDIILWRFCADNGWKEYGLDSLDDFVASL